MQTQASGLLTFVLGMGAVLVLVALLALAGPRVIPNQLDKCWVELQRNMPKCATSKIGEKTFIRDLRCIRPNPGIVLVSQGTSGWWWVDTIKETDPAAGRTRVRPAPIVPPPTNPNDND